MVAVSLVLGLVALLGAGWFTASLVSSLAMPVALIIGGAAGITAFVEILRRGYYSDYLSSEEGEFVMAGISGGLMFLLVYVSAQSLIVALSPLAGLIVVGLGVAVFVLGPGILFDLLDVVSGGE